MARGIPVQFAGYTVPPTPVLTSISPTTGSIAAGNFTITATGSEFTAQSVIVFNGVALATTFVNATTLTASVSVAGATVGGKPVLVRTGSKDSAPQTFTFTA